MGLAGDGNGSRGGREWVTRGTRMGHAGDENGSRGGRDGSRGGREYRGRRRLRKETMLLCGCVKPGT